MADTSVASSKTLKRKYSGKTLKVLFALSGNKCARPGCNNPIIKAATGQSMELVVGQIAHIIALSDEGPRGKVGLTDMELNEPSNLILLCPTDHVIVDGQHETFPASRLRDWKLAHERKYGEQLSSSISDIGYAELEVAARSLLSSGYHSSGTLVTIPPQAKIEKNHLGPTSVMLLTMGSAKSREVSELLVNAAQLNPDFPQLLRTGFVARYDQARLVGLTGDNLFNEMYEWAAGVTGDKNREAAGLCILSHLFLICDVFEK
ncbi:HNH endonuclease signature motif containing protein [Mesorhizobium sp. M1365]|uniref:HNH endonuclease signature motif containing protein n=1 Tax=Mesorhizobium sp. M1365 TaxID=2957090 RepID=UPI00333986E9